MGHIPLFSPSFPQRDCPKSQFGLNCQSKKDDYISDITFKARIAWGSHSSVIFFVGHGVDGRRGLPDQMKK